ncbi:hypothetical protein A167_00121 [Alcanivorax sp. S71-1-4]|uniref:DUF4269 domain-containing protein n=1 Tax=Alcanivorax sp. S71-1-4 TaxID=1177159 RepID=UPI00135AB290|nr:DUF4269 domain-containing protein [Alcanivorax sp. S71-1-4]KAF0811089.1 hypothetical protein A167_00121 [Alcanivorax sp. S71-1-4]
MFDHAQQAIAQAGITTHLAVYQPHIVSTLFVHFDVADSDIDVICTCPDLDLFLHEVSVHFNRMQGFEAYRRTAHVVAHFHHEGFVFEIYGSSVPPARQLAMRHYRVMQRLSALGGEPLQTAVRGCRQQQGLKTEPAIADVLGLTGDPYAAVLALEDWDDTRLSTLIRARLR